MDQWKPGFFSSPKDRGEDGHKGQPALSRALREHVDVVGSPAAAGVWVMSRGHLMGVIPWFWMASIIWPMTSRAG